MVRTSEFLESFSAGHFLAVKCRDLAASRTPRKQVGGECVEAGRRKDLKGGGERRGRGLRVLSRAPPLSRVHTDVGVGPGSIGVWVWA